MPINATPVTSEMIINLDNGLSATGNVLVRARRYSGVKPDAANEDIYNIASEMAALQERQVINIQRRDITELSE
ncbi:hypothetical protein SYNTR_2256 [Candidatus Syntrophocurvum alkaliphilum]|uniref:DUF1659 domain-containing protein n=1 Tax=Candidatus Syntrophocurvum alkaliphilum TaxID=2293317 RepID=A0A6I6DM93_9FIRM|nr:DUF1659 domain-containing protein [Candidatus Syntrophocurvum alkaliphilum]QGU00850.1 hypothetical protein SYNTR_2256 [Candidatus Syntrophocurvum alkaliphilum]